MAVVAFISLYLLGQPAGNSNQGLLWFQMVTALGALLVVGLLGILTARQLSRRFSWFTGMISKVADKDLTTRIVIRADDELGDMGKEFNRMMAVMEQMITSIQNAVLVLADDSKQLSASAGQMAGDADEVAGQASTVATASEEMAATSMEIAQNCTMAAEGSNQANSTAMDGAGVVQETISGMQRIAMRVRVAAETVSALGERSDQIGAIIGTIEDIADQTNLLALNAAIEAARAGEMGRGFAVVADEVRALAERTTKATREIGEMIKAIQMDTKGAVMSMEEGVTEVEKGTEEAAKSGEALEQILNQIQNVTMQVSQIATAAEEQNATTSEITNNIQQITTVAQGSAEMAQTSMKAATSLSEMADKLQTDIRMFKTAASEVFILELAKGDHKAFVAGIEAVLKGRERKDGAALSTHHTCRFGKWYDNEGKALCGHLPSYKAIYAPHEKIHAVARQVVDAVNSGNLQQAQSLYPQLADLSRQVISLLTEIRREFENQQAKAA
jgi:methyl-accepting chemotaxis protein